MTAREIYEAIIQISEPRNQGKMVWEIETWTEKTARLPLEQLVWAFCKPDKDKANEVVEIARQESAKAWADEKK